MRRIGIYRTEYPLPSEAFITEQAAAMRRYRPFFLVRSKRGPIGFEHMALSEQRLGRLSAPIFAATHIPWFFSRNMGRHDLSLIHAHFGPDGVYAMPLAKALGVPLVVTFHGGDCSVSHSALWRSGKLYNYHFILREGQLKSQARAFLAVSDFVRGILVDKGYPASRVVRHYIGVDTQMFRPTMTRSGNAYILSVGRHVEKKGLDVLLKAFSRIAGRYPSVSLLQVGTGALTARLSNLADSLGIRARVMFLGSQPHHKVVELMQRATIFSLPSQTAASGDSEALGVALNEASACGIPVVATRHGGIPEAVLDGDTGFLVPERDDKALAERLDTLLSDRALARRMGRRGREYVCEVFDLRRQTNLLERIYDHVLEQ
jgi:colanic acid/amylovoran biosynthesis glycosyltransferase